MEGVEGWGWVGEGGGKGGGGEGGGVGGHKNYHGLCGSLHKVCIFFFAMAPMPSLCTVKKAEFRTKKKRYQINKFLGLFGYKTRFLQ